MPDKQAARPPRLRRAGIIGGGALGLAAALRLAEAGVAVAVIEQEECLGGLAAGFSPLPGSPITLEKFYHHLFRTDRTAIRFVQELGLAPQLVWGRPVTSTLRGGRLYAMTPLGTLRFAAVPFVDRLRLIAILAALKLAPNAKPFARSTAEQWTHRWAGRRIHDALLGPLLRGKFGERAPDVAMTWLWSRFHERSLSLGYLQGGFQQFYDALGERIRALGGTILLGTAARSITTRAAGTLEGGRVTVETDSGSLEFDRLLVTAPQRALARLAPQVAETYVARYPGPDFYSAHVLILALDRPLTSAYWINVADPGFPFLVLVEHTNFIPAEQYGGLHLVYLGNYLPGNAPVFGQSDEEVLAAYLPALRRFNPRFDPSWVRQHWIFKAPFAQPIVTAGYLDRLPPFRTPLPGVLFASMAHVYPQDRGQNYSLALGERMAAMLLDELRPSS